MGWSGIEDRRFYSSPRPELDLRLSARMGDAELVGQSRSVLFRFTVRHFFSARYPHHPLIPVLNHCSSFGLPHFLFPTSEKQVQSLPLVFLYTLPITLNVSILLLCFLLVGCPPSLQALPMKMPFNTYVPRYVLGIPSHVAMQCNP